MRKPIEELKKFSTKRLLEFLKLTRKFYGIYDLAHWYNKQVKYENKLPTEIYADDLKEILATREHISRKKKL